MKGKPLDYIIGHSSKVNCIIEADNLIWSSSNDRTIRVWSPDTADCLKILHAHSGPVYSLSTSSEFVWSASWDKSIIIWDAKVCFILLVVFNFFLIIIIISNSVKHL